MTKFIVKRDDKYRAILTETIPFETPIIFSNEGLYKTKRKIDRTINNENDRYKKFFEAITKIDNNPRKIKPSKPFKYYIKKDDFDFRVISLLHPSAQLKISEFIHEYSDIITYYCNQSEISLRHPYKETSSFYIKSKDLMNIYKLKGEEKSSHNIDIYSLYSPSYFSYKTYDRIYKFINSEEFIKLESKFNNLMTLDIIKCFHNIYTHSISWATKNKDIIKKNINKNHFADDFDKFIRQGNYNETHGIPIGPEISRIFAEIILQKIDKNIINNLKEKEIIYNKDYEIRRYVDDLYIFSKDKNIQSKVKDSIIYEFSLYNLHINKNKTKELERPFITKKSVAIQELSTLINELSVENLSLIKNHHRFKNSFINKVKSILLTRDLKYHDINSFLISSISKRLKNYMNKKEDSIDKNVINMIIDIIFFFFSIYSNASIGNVICSNILQINENLGFIKDGNSIILNLYQRIQELHYLTPNNRKTISIEHMNIILITKVFEPCFRFSPNYIKDIFLKMGEKSDYFSIISSLFYIENIDNDVTNEIVSIIIERINSEEENYASEIHHLLLDIMSCPYISRIQKKHIYTSCKRRLNFLGLGAGLGDSLLEVAEKNYIFVNWKNFSMHNSLFKKELTKRMLKTPY